MLISLHLYTGLDVDLLALTRTAASTYGPVRAHTLSLSSSYTIDPAASARLAALSLRDFADGNPLPSNQAAFYASRHLPDLVHVNNLFLDTITPKQFPTYPFTASSKSGDTMYRDLRGILWRTRIYLWATQSELDPMLLFLRTKPDCLLDDQDVHSLLGMCGLAVR